MLIDANVWFSEASLRRLFTEVSSKPNIAAVVGRRRGLKDSEPEIFATYLPSAAAGRLLDLSDRESYRASLDEIRGLSAECGLIDAAQLDREFPPVRIHNLLDVALLERRIFYNRACAALVLGVRIRDPKRISIFGELQCGVGVEIETDVIIEGRVSLGDGVKIGAGSILKNAVIGANARVNPFSIVEDAVIGSSSFVGPYGRVRPGSHIGDSVQIGNFVEIKNSTIGAGSRINHLAFLGDATLEKDVTVGAGSITCNHNGVEVQPTRIGAGAYIGCGTQLVAPLVIGENATIAAGSTVTEDAPAGKLTIARSRQETVENWSRPKNDKK